MADRADSEVAPRRVIATQRVPPLGYYLWLNGSGFAHKLVRCVGHASCSRCRICCLAPRPAWSPNSGTVRAIESRFTTHFAGGGERSLGGACEGSYPHTVISGLHHLDIRCSSRTKDGRGHCYGGPTCLLVKRDRSWGGRGRGAGGGREAREGVRSGERDFTSRISLLSHLTSFFTLSFVTNRCSIFHFFTCVAEIARLAWSAASTRFKTLHATVRARGTVSFLPADAIRAERAQD